jgi:6-phosphofructokinase 2
VLEDLLVAEGVSGRSVPIGGSTRQSLSVFERSTREQYRFVMPGPDLRASEWQQCLDKLGRTSADIVNYVVASGSLPPGVPSDFYARAAHLLRERGIHLILDTSGDALAAALEERVYLIKPNARELRALSGTKPIDEDGLVSFAKELVTLGKCQIVALSLGAQGAILIAGGQHEMIAPPKIKARSAVGAGDSLVGGMTLALARGLSPRKALRYGVAAGTASLLTPGTELCRRDDVERLYRELIAE